MKTKAIFRQADVTRALKGVKAAGCVPTESRIEPSGTIVISHEPETPKRDVDLYEEWRAKRARPA